MAESCWPAQEWFASRKSVSRQPIGYEIKDGFAFAGECHGYVVADKTIVDLFAAQLHAAVEAGTASRDLYDAFVKEFGGDAGKYIGD